MDTVEAKPRTEAKLLGELPLRLHHNAYVVKDHEANRQFLEDLLGIPLVATWCEKTYRADLGREVEFCHTFFGLKDGGALAFFQFADDEMYELTQAKAPPKVGTHYHIALKVGDRSYDELKGRLNAAGEPFRETVDHGYCKSIYTQSPDGMIPRIHLRPARRRRDRRRDPQGRRAQRTRALARRRPPLRQQPAQAPRLGFRFVIARSRRRRGNPRPGERLVGWGLRSLRSQ